MLLKLFKQSYFAQIALLTGLAVIIWMPAFIRPQISFSPLSNPFTAFIFGHQTITFTIVAFVFILFEAFLVSHLFSMHQLTHRNSFLSGFLFVLFLSRTPVHLGFHSASVALLFVLLGLFPLLNMFKPDRSLNSLLTASIMFSIASLFAPSAVYLFPIIWISLIIFQNFNWRSIPITIVGLVFPYLLIGSIAFLTDNSIPFTDQLCKQLSILFILPTLPKTSEFVELTLAAILLFLASSYILPRIGNQVISIRKKTSMMYVFLGASILISFFSSDISAREIVFIPFAGILGFYFSAVKKQFWADVFVSLIFLLTLFQNYRILFYA